MPQRVSNWARNVHLSCLQRIVRSYGFCLCSIFSGSLATHPQRGRRGIMAPEDPQRWLWCIETFSASSFLLISKFSFVSLINGANDWPWVANSSKNCAVRSWRCPQRSCHFAPLRDPTCWNLHWFPSSFLRVYNKNCQLPNRNWNFSWAQTLNHFFTQFRIDQKYGGTWNASSQALLERAEAKEAIAPCTTCMMHCFRADHKSCRYAQKRKHLLYTRLKNVNE